MKIRQANKNDLVEIVKMLANDHLGASREVYQDPLPQAYFTAFDRISNDDNQELVVIEDDSADVIGTLQLSFIQYLTYQGGIRAQIEAVRIKESHRGHGIGEQLIRWAIHRSKERGAHLVQLTTDKKRPDAIKFYQRVGFVPSHEGMKLHFERPFSTI